MTRSISTTGLALRYGLACNVPRIRAACERHVLQTIRRYHGHAGRIADALDVHRTTYEGFRRDYPVLANAHDSAALRAREKIE